MREYERIKTEAENNTNVRCTCRILDEDAAAATTVNNLEGVCVPEFINSKNHSSIYQKLKSPT